MSHRLRHRRRVARARARAHGLRSWAAREWRWAKRDVRDLRAELRFYRQRALERMRNPAPFIRDDELAARERALARRCAELAAILHGPDFEVEPRRGLTDGR